MSPIAIPTHSPTNEKTLKLPITATPEAADLFSWPKVNEHGYKIREEPLGTKRPMRVIVLGAGASGINFCKIAEDMLENVEVVCYEKDNEVGGTWFENVYVKISIFEYHE